MLLLAFTWLAVHPGVPISLLLLLPLIADGSIQAFTTYESRNSRRLWTGFLFGYGLANLLFLSCYAAFRWGVDTGLQRFS